MLNMNKLHTLFEKKPYLAWYISDKEKMSKISIVEHILNYGNWDDYLIAEKALGIKNTQAIFENIKSKKRVNLRPQTINYFDKYYGEYA